MRNSIKKRITRTDLPNANVIININLEFLKDAKKAKKDSKGNVPIYYLHDMSYNQMKKYVTHLPSEKINYIEKIMKNFPENANIYEQCAYYFRAFSRGQIFLDGNHRTGFFSLARILKKKGIIIKANLDEISGLTEYIKGQGWYKLGEITVNLKGKDEEYSVLSDWFKEQLDFG